jgi:glutaredoxin 3
MEQPSRSPLSSSSTSAAVVVVYSRRQCDYCAKAKRFFADHGVDFAEIVLDPENPDDVATTEKLRASPAAMRLGGQKTFPWIFIDGTLMGGFDNLMHGYATGTLRETLRRRTGIDIGEPDF